MSQTEMQTKKGMNKKYQSSISKNHDTITKAVNTYTMGILEGEGRKQKQKQETHLK